MKLERLMNSGLVDWLFGRNKTGKKYTKRYNSVYYTCTRRHCFYVYGAHVENCKKKFGFDLRIYASGFFRVHKHIHTPKVRVRIIRIQMFIPRVDIGEGKIYTDVVDSVVGS